MDDKYNSRRPTRLIAKDYFEYLGRQLPQQCASDEFYFFPRAESAMHHLNILDDMKPEKIQDHVQHVKELLREMSSDEADDLEEEIDRLLLKQSMKSFVREFEDSKVWRYDPTLYVKIPLFATDHILSKRGSHPDEIGTDLLTIFDQIPSFLNVAIKNLYHPSEISIKVALDMVRDAIHFFRHEIPAFVAEKSRGDKEIFQKNRDVLGAWDRYSKELLNCSTRESFSIGEDGLEEILAVSLNYTKSLKEILETARYSYQKTQERLRTLARKIDGTKRWDLIIYEQRPSISSSEELMELFEKQVEDLRRFFYTQDIIPYPSGENLHVLQTPSYLKSLRATASYRAPLTRNAGDHGIFYVTPGKEDLELTASHCTYLTAHETYPGHHILDHLRIHYSNPIRRQIESPLFYEGWACYAEGLLDELGYVQDPREQLIGLKRQLWRNLRAALDVELQTGTITLDQAAKKIEALGFPAQRAQRQVRRFCLTPGYQLCYSMGMHEILGLRERFSPPLELGTFHKTLLGGGQLPFHLVERRLGAIGDSYSRG